MTNSKTNKSLGARMFVLAWICLFALLYLAFDDLLQSQYNPNESPVSEQISGVTQVTLIQNKQGHYVVNGTINNSTVTFMVDTGATSVAVPAHLEKKLGLRKEFEGYADTANGRVKVFSTTINTLTIGDISLNSVDAILNPGMKDDEILLGMSVLKQLEFTQRQDKLILRTL